MALESFSFINSLNVLNPANSDFLVEGDDHIRGIKQTIKSTFPNVTGPVTATHTELNRLAGIGSSVLKTTGTAGEWVQMASANISGSPTSLDFVNGTGGITIDGDYDAYEIELIDVYPVSASSLRLTFTNGSGFPHSATVSNYRTQRSTVTSGAQTITETSTQAYIEVCDSITVASLASSGTMTIRLNRPTASLNVPIFCEFEIGLGVITGHTRAYVNMATSQFTGIRVGLASTIAFANAGSYRFRARKA